MKKRILAILLVAALAMCLVACGNKNDGNNKGGSGTGTGDTQKEVNNNTTVTDPKVKLVYAEVNPLDSIVGKMAVKFKEEVERLSNGSIEIDIQASGVLGAENDVLDTMLGGGNTIDIARISAFSLTAYGGAKSKLLSIPYTFENRDHFWNFANSDLAPQFLMEPHDSGSGVRGLFYGEEGFRHFFTKSEINGLSDLAGMKLRVSNDPIMNGMVNGLGASPTVVSFGELYSALQTGVVDGAEQPIANYKSNSFQEVAPYMILDGHTLGAIQVIITDAAWDKLTANQQKAITDAGKLASDYNRQVSEDAENTVLNDLKAEGIHIIDVTDKAPWKEACKDIIAESTKDNSDLYQKILALK